MDAVSSELDIAEPTARNFMSMADHFAKSANVADFSPQVLHALAAPSVPDKVVTKASAKAKASETVTLEPALRQAQHRGHSVGKPWLRA